MADFLRVGNRVRLDRLDDGRIMCCLCFEYCTHAQLCDTDEPNIKTDVCQKCMYQDGRRTGDALTKLRIAYDAALKVLDAAIDAYQLVSMTNPEDKAAHAEVTEKLAWSVARLRELR